MDHIRVLFFAVEEMSQQTPEGSPELTKRSWFGSLMSTDRDETYTIIVKGKPLASIKADLVHAFLSVSLCEHVKHFTSVEDEEEDEVLCAAEATHVICVGSTPTYPSTYIVYIRKKPV